MAGINDKQDQEWKCGASEENCGGKKKREEVC